MIYLTRAIAVNHHNTFHPLPLVCHITMLPTWNASFNLGQLNCCVFQMFRLRVGWSCGTLLSTRGDKLVVTPSDKESEQCPAFVPHADELAQK